jgi:methionine synthase I (cobalamin-dependent)
MDGAMGTEIQRAGIAPGESYEAWNLTHPDQIQSIHQAYVDAGARVLLTNTFQANPAALARHGLQDQVETIGQAALGLARSVARDGLFVLADMGPMPSEMVSYPGASRVLLQPMAGLLGSADGIVLETFSDLTAFHLVELLQQSNDFADKAVLVSFGFLHGPSGICTRDSRTPEAIARQASHHDLTALGANCGRDIDMCDVLEIVRRYRQATDLPLFARPNAGTPTRVGDRWVYPQTPEKMARRLPELLEAGITMVGGCCGTTPEHIAQFRPLVETWNARHSTSGKQP